MRFEINPDYQEYSEQITDYILNFDSQGEPYGNQDRNSLKLFKLPNTTINIKSFKVPNAVNKIVYRFFRKSKAQRSFIHANYLTQFQIGTPTPVGYFEFPSSLVFKRSYYISEQLECDYTFRDLTKDFSIPEHDKILRQFTRFTFNLHENNILFLDHSPGNTLIKKNANEYDFYLVDLNRMEFRKLDLTTRIKNFERLSTHESMVKVMSDEYAKLSNQDPSKIFEMMWKYTQDFQNKYHRKKRLKKKILFWRS